MKVKESLNVTFDESPPPTKLSPLVDDDVGEEEAIENNTKVVNNSNEEDEMIKVDKVVNIKESKYHPLEQVIEPKNVNEALGDESWVIVMQEELNQFVANDVWDLVPLPMSQTVMGTKWVFKNKLDENGIVSRNKARLVAQGLINKKFEMSMIGELNFFLGLQIKQMEDEIFFNQSKYIKEMLKKFGLEDSKPTKTPMSTEIKLIKDNEADFVDCTKYQGVNNCHHLSKWITNALKYTYQELGSLGRRFKTIITSLKALDEGFSSKNYVRKFLRALHPKWREKVTAIEESKDLSSLALDELIGNLNVHEVFMEKDSEIYKGKKERVNCIALKAKKESSDDETSTSGSDDEQYAMAVRNFKKFFRRKGKFVRKPREEKRSFRQRDEKKGKSDRKCFRCGDLNHLIGDCSKPPHNKDQKAFIRGS
ncbi:zf-CCHC domain-containing protein [Tanacetum coccineum]